MSCDIPALEGEDEDEFEDGNKRRKLQQETSDSDSIFVINSIREYLSEGFVTEDDLDLDFEETCLSEEDPSEVIEEVAQSFLGRYFVADKHRSDVYKSPRHNMLCSMFSDVCSFKSRRLSSFST